LGFEAQKKRVRPGKTIFLDNILRSTISMAIVATDSTLKIKYFNPVAEKVFGCSALRPSAVLPRMCSSWRISPPSACPRRGRPC
jgi:PAS domain-containing protein